VAIFYDMVVIRESNLFICNSPGFVKDIFLDHGFALLYN